MEWILVSHEDLSWGVFGKSSIGCMNGTYEGIAISIFVGLA